MNNDAYSQTIIINTKLHLRNISNLYITHFTCIWIAAEYHFGVFFAGLTLNFIQ